MVQVTRTRRTVLTWIGTGLGAAALISTASTFAHAGAALGEAAEFIHRFADTALATMRDRSRGREQQVRKLSVQMSSGFDLDRIAKLSLGRYWKAATPAEREQFVELFKLYILASYTKRFDEYASRELRVAGAAPAGEDAMVESYLLGGPAPVRLDWRLSPEGGSWRILDVMVEGVSLLLTYRNEFASVIEKGGGRVSALIAELRSRLAAERVALAS